MALVTMVSEEEATGRVAEIYDEIKAQLGIDFVPHLYQVMAGKPGYLDANWSRVQAIMVDDGQLDRLTKEIIAVAVSAVNSCDY